MVVVERRDGGGYDLVLLAVVVEQLASGISEGGEVAVPGVDVADVFGPGVGGHGGGDGAGVEGGVVVDGVAEPVVGVEELGGGVNGVGGGEEGGAEF